MITYAEVKQSPSGWLDATPDTMEDDIMEDFETALASLLDQYHNKVNKGRVSVVLAGSADIVERDETWVYDEVNLPPATPVLSSLSPATAVLDSEDITLSCIGSDFDEDAVINFAGYDEPTTFVSATEVTTIVKPSLGWGEVAVPVLVKNGAIASAPLDFTFTAAP